MSYWLAEDSFLSEILLENELPGFINVLFLIGVFLWNKSDVILALDYLFLTDYLIFDLLLELFFLDVLFFKRYFDLDPPSLTKSLITVRLLLLFYFDLFLPIESSSDLSVVGLFKLSNF